MEKFLLLREKAMKDLKAAEQALNFTYPLVKDSKVLLSVVHKLFLATSHIIESLLHHELIHKRISGFEDNFESKYHILRTQVMDRYNIDKEYLRLARDLKDIIIAHHESPIEFSRAGKFIICNDNYELKQITPETLKKTFLKTKLFIEEVIYLTTKKDILMV